ncbi:hypothetical protein H4S07_001226 [Coemansia furcata]|uniref:Uncharacterized protein n=1 Tax=Coemansia furcata TaxID=417177 RepID=A0ACC1LPW0_9FUNG|nr:hypothetical protein H4S07_001226 [Coemansia furcata]
MRLPVLATVWATVLTSALGQPSEDGHASSLSKRLNSGSTLTRKDFDSIVQIGLNNKNVAIEGCVGVLISPWHVLTQNVCLYPDPYITTPNYANMTVTIGKTASDNTKTLYKFTVSGILGGDQLANEKVSSRLAILILNKEVKSNIVKPAKLYGGDYKTTTPAMLIGLATSSTGNSTASLKKMRYENVAILSNSYCQGANRIYDEVGEMCTLVKGSLNTCKGDFGAPIFTEVDNDGSTVEPVEQPEGSKPSKSPAKAKAYALLALTTDSVLPGKTAPPMGCSLTGSTGYYTWVYPFINQIAALIDADLKNITLVNNTLSSTTDPFLHPDMVTTQYGGIAKTASLSAAALLVWAAAAMF